MKLPTVQGMVDKFNVVAVPPHASAAQRFDMTMAFGCGAIAIFNAITEDTRGMADEDACKMLSQFEGEFDAKMAQLLSQVASISVSKTH